jgi:hypothetical protein
MHHPVIANPKITNNTINFGIMITNQLTAELQPTPESLVQRTSDSVQCPKFYWHKSEEAALPDRYR